MRTLALLILCAVLGQAQQIRLYLKDGGFHVVREYKVAGDRVRYYSTERSEWEEMPVALIDLKRTEDELSRKADVDKREAALADAEEKFEREQAAEVASVPMNPGAYVAMSGKVEPMKHAELKMVNDKKRSVLKVLAPIPIVAGKFTLEIDGEHSPFTVTDPRPFFYFRLDKAEMFGIVRLQASKKGSRIVETIQVVPVSNEIFAERKEVESFRQQFRDGLYKIWPVKPLEPGEYAVVEYSASETQTQAWDFRVAAGGQEKR
jgi:hypothetical protein